MPAHPLHESIGSLLWNNQFLIDNDYFVERDSACGGDYKISMYCVPQCKNEFNFVDVNILITKDKKIKVIVDIEESSVDPVSIMGKFIASALSPYHIYIRPGINVNCVLDYALFIQVCDTKATTGGTSKKDQFKNIEAVIKKMLPTYKGSIVDYRIIPGLLNEFDGVQGIVLKKAISDFLSK